MKIIVHQKIQASFITLILSVTFNLSSAQPTSSIPVEVTKVHQDNITIRSEMLPEFKNSVHDQESQGNQISGVIRTVCQDRKGNFWFGTQNGLARYDQSGLVYFDLRAWNGEEVVVHVVLEDTSGTIWIGFGGGIAKYDGTYFTTYHQKDILIKSSLWSMCMDRNGLLWVGTTEGVYTFDGQALNYFGIPEGQINPNVGVSTTKMIHSIVEDRAGNLWFATNSGVYIYDGDTLKNILNKERLQSPSAHQIIERNAGNFWIATSAAIYNYSNDSLTNITEKLMTADDSVGCIFEDKKGTLWFTMNGRDIYNYDGKEFTKINVKEGDFKPLPFQIYQDQQERIWFVGLRGAHRFENNVIINVNRDGPW